MFSNAWYSTSGTMICFFVYFMTYGVLCLVGYLLFHSELVQSRLLLLIALPFVYGVLLFSLFLIVQCLYIGPRNLQVFFSVWLLERSLLLICYNRFQQSIVSDQALPLKVMRV